MRLRALLVAALTCGLLVPTAVASAAPPPLTSFDLTLTRRWIGLDQPLFIAAPRSAPQAGAPAEDRLFIVERPGRIRVVRNGVLQARPYLDLSAEVGLASAEQGLLGLAFAPQFYATGRFYVYYVDREGAIVVRRFRARDRNSVRPAFDSRVVMRIADPTPELGHYGGCLQFGPDGYLYISVGDSGPQGDPSFRAQNLAVPFGKLLRVDTGDRPGGARPTTYVSPPDNPHYNTAGALKGIWASGLRNPWRFSFDSLTGHLWLADVGDAWREEVNWQSAGFGGNDYGWNVFEGSLPYPPGSPGPVDATEFTFPIFESEHPRMGSITGGYVYRGSRYPLLRGTYVFGDFVTGKVIALRRLPAVEFERKLDTALSISSFGESATGELYLCDIAGGAVYRIGAR